MSIFDRLLGAGSSAARAGLAAGRAAADAAMRQPGVRRRVEEARARVDDARGLFEQRFSEVEKELWEWLNRMQAEAQKAHRQVERARNSEDFYRVLDLEPGADMKTVKKAYHRKMRENHPDKFAHDPVEEQAAHARAQVINEAYQQLSALLTGRENRSAT